MDVVRDAIRSVLQVGDVLQTPGRGYPPSNQSEFHLKALDERGVWIDKLTVPITWAELEGVPAYIARLGGSVEVGATKAPPRPLTLEFYLQETRPGPMRASYVAPILKKAGIVEYVPERGARRIRIPR